MDTQLIITISIMHLVALISPGPDFAIIVRLATLASRQSAIAAALGIAVAIAIHTLLSLTGLSLAIHNSDKLYTLVQVIGASYLAWMGFSALKGAMTIPIKTTSTAVSSSTCEDEGENLSNAKAANNNLASSNKPIEPSMIQGFKIGLLTNLLNPKAMVFFLTLFSTLVTPAATLGTKIALGWMLFSLSFIWFALVSVMLSKASVQQKFRRMSRAIDAITGLIFVIVAMMILYQLILL